MLRLLIWLGIAYLLIRTLRKLGVFGHISAGSDGPGSRDRNDNLMVKDPYCGVYFLRKDGHHLRHGGEDLYFCSPECRDNYMKDHAN